MIRSALLALAAVFVLSACSEDPASPTVDTSSYVVSTKGSYFLHDNTMILITNGGATRDSAIAADSTVVNGTVSKDGRSAVESIVFVNNTATDTTYMSQEGSKTYSLLELKFAAGPTVIDLGTRWTLLYDGAVSNWTVLRDTIPTLTIPIGSGSYTGTAGLNFTGKNVGSENILINGASVSTTKVEITLGITLYLNIAGTIMPYPFELKRYCWLAKNIGVVKIEQVPLVINPGVALPIPGMRSTVTKFSVAS